GEAMSSDRELFSSRPVRRRRLRRRAGAWVRLIAALFVFGALYTAFAPHSSADDTAKKLSDQALRGKQLYDVTCISCHGENAQGVTGRGPSLIGVGSASVEFQVDTGRMPAARQEAQVERKKPKFSTQEAQ